MRSTKEKGNLTDFRARCRFLAALLCAGLLLAGCRSGGTAANQNAEPADGNEPLEVSVEEDSSAEAGVGSAGTGSTEHSSAAAAAPGLSVVSGTGGTQTQSAEAGATAAAPALAVQDAPSGNSGEAVGVFSAEGKGLLIVLDPGHSSSVPGTTEPVGPGSSEMKEADTVGTYGPASGLHEYELTMRVSQKLRAELEKRGYEVRLTHLDTVRPISCVERAEVANENQADAFVRIHANGSEDTSANGAMTICITRDNPYHPELYSASYRLSEILLDTFCEQTGAKKESVWETDSMTGNNWSEVPATLIELGYMTNPDEDLNMAMDSYQKKMVTAIADGLDLWFADMPEEELAMHPVLTGAQREEISTQDTAEQSADTPAYTPPQVLPEQNEDLQNTDETSPEDDSSPEDDTSPDGSIQIEPAQNTDSREDDVRDGSAAEDGTGSDENLNIVPEEENSADSGDLTIEDNSDQTDNAVDSDNSDNTEDLSINSVPQAGDEPGSETEDSSGTVPADQPQNQGIPFRN